MIKTRKYLERDFWETGIATQQEMLHATVNLIRSNSP
jgi:hypothetical protein